MEKKMAEEDARLALLQTELKEIQASIRSLDTIMVQVKGWCVTVSLAIGGFAVGQKRPALLVVGVVAVMGFYIVTCQAKVVQRFFLSQNKKLNDDVEQLGIMEVLAGRGSTPVTGTTVLTYITYRPENESYLRMMIRNFHMFRREAVHPDVLVLYLFIIACFVIAIIVSFSWLSTPLRFQTLQISQSH
jgi:hypothetical protein